MAAATDRSAGDPELTRGLFQQINQPPHLHLAKAEIGIANKGRRSLRDDIERDFRTQFVLRQRVEVLHHSYDAMRFMPAEIRVNQALGDSFRFGLRNSRSDKQPRCEVCELSGLKYDSGHAADSLGRKAQGVFLNSAFSASRR